MTLPTPDFIRSSTAFVAEQALSENHPADHKPADNATDPEHCQPPSATTEIDGGYGWVCVSYGVFLAHYPATNTFPGVSDLGFAFIGDRSLSMVQFIAPVATITTRSWGTTNYLNIGITLQTAALLGASWASQIWQLFLSHALCFGFGMGMQFSAIVSIIPQWFTRRRSLANGVATAGSRIGFRW
ncbi:hypothetical protein TMatcc_011281 [Talaromyces marneffei ATCC 18224]|uniref:Major facilitator superfamily (MFS) profile domain-containing protein n=1 Tax=Talaromyces marneffei (strain ATCC 18224 / CBS 334.59 / QM 7333) TaxID=441960 RepID=B6QEZ8_TALMQ|nr:uncharacterized protein EYB26_005048 [Talaromyces marneffei]EEA25053.1 conserved hypothetical protein [Talaromyces marneffei ATCC 18224]KAE8552486.1 hypothetical protein EYB25_003864 [Talaromyces marneffei]QGA17377.1 hypothetical protein EYB26_005048 [Talaromyces marneffei]